MTISEHKTMNKHQIEEVLSPDIDTVECGFGDVQGQLRGKRVPARHFKQILETGFGMADALFSWDHECGIMMEATYTNAGVGFPAMELFPMLDTLRKVPWREGAASVLCESRHPDGRRVAIDPRNVLVGVLDQAAGEGYTFNIGTELEFYLLGQDNNPVGDVIQCYSLSAGAPWEHVMRPLRRMLDEFGIYVEACNTEYAPGQFEMNVRYDQALDSADNTLRFKAAVREISNEHGLMATFMPKPFPGESGNGLHVHQSVLSDGNNVFADEGGQGVLGNELMEHYLAGLLEHMPALMFLGGSSVNAYKRLEEYSFAPMNATWGHDNRTVGIRTVGHGSGRRIEYRGAAADANPYLIIAGCIAAGLDGVKNKLALPARVDGDAYALGLSLPATLAEGIAAFETDEVLKNALGEHMSLHLLELARREWGLFSRAVTDWERDRYLRWA